MALTFENQIEKKNTALMQFVLDTRFKIKQFKLNTSSQVSFSYISVMYMDITYLK